MKVNRKTVLSTAAVLGVAALVAGGTIAYFTDNEAATNSFTVGDIDITLYESQLHRVNSNMLGGEGINNLTTAAPTQNNDNHNCAAANGLYNAKLVYCTPGIILGTSYSNYTDGQLTAWDNNHVVAQNFQGQTGAFTDAQIIADAEGTGQINANNDYKYYDGVADANGTGASEGTYVYDEYSNIVPGKQIRKFIYVKNNDGANDAYVRVKVNVPASVVDYITVNSPSTAFKKSNSSFTNTLTKDGKTLVNNYYQCVGKNGSVVAFEGTGTSSNVDYSTDGEYMGYLEDDGSRTYSFYLSEALEAGEMTYWSPVNTVFLKSDLTQSDISNLASLQTTGFGITVTADAVQAETFNDAASAFGAANI